MFLIQLYYNGIIVGSEGYKKMSNEITINGYSLDFYKTFNHNNLEEMRLEASDGYADVLFRRDVSILTISGSYSYQCLAGSVIAIRSKMLLDTLKVCNILLASALPTALIISLLSIR